jgi:hypothetical protein
MQRLHLFEFGDQDWCPSSFRDAETALLEFIVGNGNYYAPVLPLLARGLREAGASEIVDLCSGGGGPWRKLLIQGASDLPATIRLTDKFPNVEVAEHVATSSGHRVVVESRSIEAQNVPPDLRGFRTLFTAFHHFHRDEAAAILRDAVRAKVGIGVFEFTQRSVLGFMALFFTPLAVLVCVPFLRPFRWSWALFTYIIPLIPLMAMFDGIVSCLRTYSPKELRILIEKLGTEEYEWDVGTVRSWRSPLPVTYLIGRPR